LVAARPEAERAAELLLGQILLVQDAAAAYRIAPHLPAGCTAVSLDGFIAHPGGLVERGSGQSSILAREREWREDSPTMAIVWFSRSSRRNVWISVLSLITALLIGTG
jgi:chromosome segregation ATPase